VGFIRKFITIIGTAGIFVGGAALIALMGSLRPKIEPKEVTLAPPAVFYAVVEPRPVTLNVYAQGEVRPRTDINLTAEVAGRIIRTADAFVAGGAFRKGELLVKIEDADYRVCCGARKPRPSLRARTTRRLAAPERPAT
jgi:multidrug efflux pump subunit AcrA (membrane-fusion protein)